MRFGSQRENPRHFAAGDRAGHPAEAGGPARHRAGSHPRPRPPQEPELELQEVPPPVRVQRSRLALAVAVTVAALPILVLDNLPATADTGQGVETAGQAQTTEMSIVLMEPSTTSTTAAPTTVATAPTTTAPATTEAPTTTERVVVQAAKAPTPTTQRPTTTTAAPKPVNGDPSDPATWDKLARCEAGGNWAMNSGNGYYGGLQFSLATWQDVGGTGYPHQASRAEQIKRGQILQARSGWGAWPTCARELGYY